MTGITKVRSLSTVAFETLGSGGKGVFTMPVETTVVDGILLVHLAGELDHHAVESIRQDIETGLESVRHRGLVLSFRGIDFMDSSGLGLILGRYRSVKEHKGRMALCEVNTTLSKLFELSGILKILPVFESEQAAILALKEA